MASHARAAGSGSEERVPDAAPGRVLPLPRHTRFLLSAFCLVVVSDVLWKKAIRGLVILEAN